VIRRCEIDSASARYRSMRSGGRSSHRRVVEAVARCRPMESPPAGYRSRDERSRLWSSYSEPVEPTHRNSPGPCGRFAVGLFNRQLISATNAFFSSTEAASYLPRAFPPACQAVEHFLQALAILHQCRVVVNWSSRNSPPSCCFSCCTRTQCFLKNATPPSERPEHPPGLDARATPIKTKQVAHRGREHP